MCSKRVCCLFALILVHAAHGAYSGRFEDPPERYRTWRLIRNGDSLVHNIKDDVERDFHISDEETNLMSAFLFNLYLTPSYISLPSIYIKEEVDLEKQPTPGAVDKRASRRYFRSFPWKRENMNLDTNSQELDNRIRYICKPSREEVANLLLRWHESRRSSTMKPGEQMVNFCHWRRPSGEIIQHILRDRVKNEFRLLQ